LGRDVAFEEGGELEDVSLQDILGSSRTFAVRMLSDLRELGVSVAEDINGPVYCAGTRAGKISESLDCAIDAFFYFVVGDD
jgi:hypothetical protein